MVRQAPSLASRLAALERRAPQIHEESTLRQGFVEALNQFLHHKGIAQRGVQIVLDEKLVRGRPDARVGAIVFEVKLPQPAGPGIEAAVSQAQGYMQEFSARHGGRQARGVAYDGLHMTLLDEAGQAIASGRPSALATKLQAWLVSLAGDVIEPADFVARLGPTSDPAHEMIDVLWQSFRQFRTQVGFIEEVFKVWQGLYGVTTNLTAEATQGLKRAASQMGITLRSKAHVEEYLFVVETYLATLLKLLVARVAVQQQLTHYASLTELFGQQSPVLTLSQLERYIPRLAGVFEEDVFLWPSDAAAYDRTTENSLNNSLHTMVQNLDDVDLVAVGHDFLRLVYQRFLDPAARRALGEFYTSPALVDEALDAVGYTGQLDKRLADITCGSGTFLIRAIQRLIHANQTADGQALLRAVTHNIIGVDIHPFAVAMARVNYILAIAELLPTAGPVPIPIYWADSLLRLSAARETMRGMRRLVTVHLPGLDEKFALPHHSDLDWHDLMARVKQAIARFPQPTLDLDAVWARFWQDVPQDTYLPYEDTVRRFLAQIVKRHNRNRDMRWLPLLENTLSVERLRQTCHFIVGNPPWVRIHNISPHIRERLFAEYTLCMDAGWRRGAQLAGVGRGFARQIDYALPFVERAIEFLRPGGRLGFVITSKVIHALYGNALRKTLVQNTRILHLSDYSLHAMPLFEDATNYPLVLSFENSAPEADHHLSAVVVGPAGDRLALTLPQSDLPLLDYDAESPWALVPPPVRRAFDRMQTAAAPAPDGSPRLRPLLGDTPGHQAQMGVKTALNSVFIVKRVDATEHPNEVVIYAEGYYNPRTPQPDRHKYVARLEKSLLRPLLRGQNVEAWRYRIQDYILWTHDDQTGRVLPDLPPKAKEYFERHADALRARSDYRSNMPIWQIFRVQREKLTDKIIWQRISSHLDPVCVPAKVTDTLLGDTTLVPIDTTRLVPVTQDLVGLALSACFNSSIARAYTAAVARRDRGAYFEFDAGIVGLLPVPEAIVTLLRDGTADPAVHRLEEISRLLHQDPSRPDRPALEDELDRLVASLYGLTDADLAALRDYFAFIRAHQPTTPATSTPQEEEPEDTDQ